MMANTIIKLLKKILSLPAIFGAYDLYYYRVQGLHAKTANSFFHWNCKLYASSLR